MSSPKAFRTEDIHELSENYSTTHQRYTNLMQAYVCCEFTSERAKEFAKHGFARRLLILHRCLTNIFNTIPPDYIGIPEEERRLDVTINVQTFVSHFFGCIDNLAWVCVEEKPVTKENGNKLTRNEVSLLKKGKLVRSSLSKSFQDFLTSESFEKWIDDLEIFRHALAHRIPLYIPPNFIIGEEKKETFEELERQKWASLPSVENPEIDAWRQNIKAIEARQHKLAEFVPIITHSFSEKSPHIFFHYMVLDGFSKIEELGWMMLDELDR